MTARRKSNTATVKTGNSDSRTVPRCVRQQGTVAQDLVYSHAVKPTLLQLGEAARPMELLPVVLADRGPAQGQQP